LQIRGPITEILDPDSAARHFVPRCARETFKSDEEKHE
jgi:hypothetical protein